MLMVRKQDMGLCVFSVSTTNNQPLGSTVRSFDRLHVFQKLNIAVRFAMQFLWPRGGLKYSTPRLRLWKPARRPCLRCSVLVSMVCGTFLCLLFLIHCCKRFRRIFVFGQEVVREATSRMYDTTPPFSGCVVLFLHGQ